MRKVIGRVKSFVIDEYPRRKTLKPMEKENLGVKKPNEVKHLSNWRKRIQKRFRK